MWHKIFFNMQSIQGETESSVLIKMPNRSNYNGYVFWHPINLVREQGGKGYHGTFSFKDDWVFKVKLYGRGRYNRKEVINEVELSAYEILEIFGVVNENVNDFVISETEKIINKENLSKPIIIVERHEPKKINPLENNIIKQLKHDANQ